ncbi:MAG: carbonic anhydrase [Gemmatimonadales bacterium]|nr:carbonic anhydrase [Gemmatimonadales bacterium]
MSEPSDSFLPRREMLGRLAVAAGLATVSRPSGLAAAPPRAGRPSTPVSPASALTMLLDGNRRFAEGRPQHPNGGLQRLKELSGSQHPFAAIFGCVDSRVPPELLFDEGLGDLFCVRSAAQVLDDAELGSLEFGVEELGIPLIVVLGHERCGAIKAALALASAHERAPDRIGMLADALKPAIARGTVRPGDQVENTVRAQVELTVERLKAVPLFAERLHDGRLDIVGARYDLDTGRVTLLQPSVAAPVPLG